MFYSFCKTDSHIEGILSDQSILLKKEKLRLWGRGITLQRTIHDQCKALEIYSDVGIYGYEGNNPWRLSQAKVKGGAYKGKRYKFS